MIKMIKDLTLEEKYKLCSSTKDCENCPINFAGDSCEWTAELYEKHGNEEIEIPDSENSVKPSETKSSKWIEINGNYFRKDKVLEIIDEDTKIEIVFDYRKDERDWAKRALYLNYETFERIKEELLNE